MPGKCVFNDLWLVHKDYKEWVQRHDTKDNTAVCSVCKRDIFIGSMGKGALDSHLDGSKHKMRMKQKREATGIDLSSFWHRADKLLALPEPVPHQVQV